MLGNRGSNDADGDGDVNEKPPPPPVTDDDAATLLNNDDDVGGGRVRDTTVGKDNDGDGPNSDANDDDEDGAPLGVKAATMAGSNSRRVSHIEHRIPVPAYDVSWMDG